MHAARRIGAAPPRARRLLALLPALLALAATAACERMSNTAVTGPPGAASAASVDVRPYLSAQAQAALDEQGRFVLPAPRATPYPRLSAQEAEARAVAWARTFGAFNRDALQEEHGAPIDFQRVQACGRSYFADTPFEPVAAGAPNHARNAYGPWWIVTLCSEARTPQVSIGVAAYATDVGIENGRIRFPAIHGNEFVWKGVPAVGGLPVSPERAVEAAFQATGRRALGVPELVRGGSFEVPLLARWRVRLESPVRVRALGSRGSSEASEVLVVQYPGEAAARLFVPRPGGAREMVRRRFTPAQRRGGPPEWFTDRVPARGGYPLEVVQVEPATGGPR